MEKMNFLKKKEKLEIISMELKLLGDSQSETL